MDTFFFSGATYSKLDGKNRFVLPQQMRYGLVENGQLKCTLALGLGGVLVMYRKSAIEKIVATFRRKQHIARYRKFFSLFFSTLHHTTCDKLGRVLLPPVLKKVTGIKQEIVIAGVLDKIEVWPKEKYESDLKRFIDEENSEVIEEAFACVDEKIADSTSGSQEEHREV